MLLDTGSGSGFCLVRPTAGTGLNIVDHGFRFAPLIAEALAGMLAGRSSETHFQHWISGSAEVMQDAAPPA